MVGIGVVFRGNENFVEGQYRGKVQVEHWKGSESSEGSPGGRGRDKGGKPETGRDEKKREVRQLAFLEGVGGDGEGSRTSWKFPALNRT